ncbi:hemerythrin domain-containing protein [Sphingobacterium sp. WM]|uniref:hemerythrin domain-containing protein n=1 Tax=Sphingobacterium sp. WM TaxID=3031802 RepID=UPI00240D3058|nr:hemerythrin domain-containing protein [Sphingobacterium sp. WM]WFB63326.1 hemerythrin domain-containing protein [Sphingobacterium sp. WM]
MLNKALTRHPALIPLSKEHHYSLLLCWKIRRGLELGIDPKRIKDYLVRSWEKQLSYHFYIEENYVFTIISQDDKLIKKALLDHKTIKKLILSGPCTIKALNRIEEKLEAHIRMEERKLFPIIQQIATPEQMNFIKLKHDQPIDELPWEDEFWVRKS